MKGIYFDFNQATLQPQSEPALKEIATRSGARGGESPIEGHTDNIGSDRYNDDLSARRAASVKAALVRDHGSMRRGFRLPATGNAALSRATTHCPESAQPPRRTRLRGRPMKTTDITRSRPPTYRSFGMIALATAIVSGLVVAAVFPN